MFLFPQNETSHHIEKSVCCSVLQCVAVCCSVLQCVAVRCSVLQCDAVMQCVVWDSGIMAGRHSRESVRELLQHTRPLCNSVESSTKDIFERQIDMECTIRKSVREPLQHTTILCYIVKYTATDILERQLAVECTV